MTTWKTTYISASVHRSGDNPIINDQSTTVTICDEAGGEFVEVSQSGRNDISKIAINPEEWPELREAINRMIQECRKNSR